MSTLNEGRKDTRRAHSAEGRRILSLLDADNRLTHDPDGRPCFADRHADFSISHSRNMAAAAWIPAPCRVGCDIQYMHPRRTFAEISRRFFHTSEHACIEEAGEEGIRNFYRIWVLKEAWLKLYGFSVFDIAKAPAFSIGGTGAAAARDESGQPDFFLYEPAAQCGPEELYMLAAARQRNYFSGCVPEPEFRWFSETTLRLNKVENIYAAQIPVNTVTPNM